MSRVTSTLVWASVGVVIAMWIVSPASSEPQDAPRAAAALDAAVAAATPVERVRLPDLLPAARDFDRPVRDPFAYSSPVRSAPAVVSPPLPPVAPAAVLPSLVAILADTTPDGARYRAALVDRSGQVQIVRAGDVHGEWTVADIRAGELALADAAGQTYRLSLR